MKNNTKKILKAGVVLFIAVLFVGMSTSAIGATPEKAAFISTKKTITPSEPTRDEMELKYYAEENLDQVIGVTGTMPAIWKTAIRLTQDEMAAYMDWTLTKVNVAFTADQGQPTINIKIYIYNKGTTPTKPGSIIVSDTTATLDTTGITTIPLTTPVPLAGHDELWVAIEWTQTEVGSFYAWIDTLSGPHVPDKSDFVFLGTWQQLHDALPEVDGRWGIGAIVEGAGLAELSIGNIKGPIGIKADVSNIGANDANNVQWSIAVTGGLLGGVNASEIGTTPSLVAGSSTPISVGMFFGFGKISIVITAKAQNANEVSVTKSAFLLGPFVIGIK
ncbi:MAG: hypothetical protein IMZ53_09285 [Thermoplasmata archaeon]|nr:hypothetical protein [Thermoplasmata archaeon]MBE3140761.1 hypothetical protein [Thermoplasmata archaeon]